MIKKISRFYVILVALVLSVPGLFGQALTDFDKIVDFSVNLKELHGMIEQHDDSRLDRSKFLLLNGTISDISPKKSWFFVPSERETNDPAGFIAKIATGNNALPRFLLSKLTQPTQALLKEYSEAPQSVPSKDLLKAFFKDLGNVVKKVPIAQAPGILTGLPLSDELRAIIALNPGGEEMAFLNRLILETAYPENLAPVAVVCELVAGEWVGLEEVKSYHGLVVFEGAESFKVFGRRRPADASSLMIPVNSRVLVVASPVSPVETALGQVYWLSRALYIRRIK